MERYQFNPKVFALLEQSVIPMAIYQLIDRRVVALAVSEGFCRMFGYSRDEVYDLMDNDMYRDVHPDDSARTADAAYRFAMDEDIYDVVYRTEVDGVYRIVHAKGEHVLTDTGVRLAVLTYTDEGEYFEDQEKYISDLNAVFNRSLHEEALLNRNYYDHLSGLPNMSYFLQLADAGKDRMLREGKTPVMLFFDLSGMKFYNRKNGFAEGDKLIRGISRLLVKYFTNESCSRLGQDHFAAFTDRSNLDERLDRLIEECAQANGGNSLPIRIGIYVGGMEESENIEASVACDRAKYACDLKRDSYISGYTYFDEKMLEDAVKRQYFIDNLDRAINEKWIQVYFQPIVRATNGRVCDEEALARWIDPQRGVISPGEFIPVLEETKLITKLDLYVLDCILAKMKEQEDAGLYVVPQSLNLSRVDFDTEDIVEIIREKVDSAGIERKKVTIEVTESVVGSDFDFMKEQVKRFQDLGFEVWMDDFGSGYSSLDVLQNIHFDLIKFDMRFMQTFFDGEESRIILTELARMAIGLGMETVCEGVETREQVQFLREIGCTKLQGYYYCKPVPMSGIIERYRTGKAIGFENPEETEYYAVLGRVNLYDMSAVARENSDKLQQYFNTIPMAVVETSSQVFRLTRCNQTFRDFMEKTMRELSVGEQIPYDRIQNRHTESMINAIRQCGQSGGSVLFDGELDDYSTLHAVIRCVAVNPVNGNAAMVVAILAIADSTKTRQAVTYTYIARALSSDYSYLYYINLENDQYVEFTSEAGHGELSLERHGNDFFHESIRQSREILHREDQAEFARLFTKENILKTLAAHGTFQLTYRQIIDGSYCYMQMKAMRMGSDDSHIIIGVSNVDARIKEKQVMDHVYEEQAAYRRIAALMDDIMVVYTVDPETDVYSEYNANQDYEELGLLKEGKDFFKAALEESVRTLHPDDVERFRSVFTKQNILDSVKNNRHLSIRYRLMIGGEPVPVRLKAVEVNEGAATRILIGVWHAE